MENNRLVEHITELAAANKVHIDYCSKCPAESAFSKRFELFTDREFERFPDFRTARDAGIVGVVHCRPVTDIRTYTIALHELGHMAAPSGSLVEERLQWAAQDRESRGPISTIVMREEAVAWKWAREHAIEWTPEMDALETWALNTYKTPQPSLQEIFDLVIEMLEGAKVKTGAAA